MADIEKEPVYKTDALIAEDEAKRLAALPE